MALHGNDDARNHMAAESRPSVLFSSASEAAAALGEAGPCGVSLVSPPDAAAFPGARVVAAMIRRAVRERPGVPFGAVLDCGAAPGLALEALRQGWRELVLDPSCPAFSAVAAAAAEVGATVLTVRPPVLDLSTLDLRKPGGRAILARWFASHRDSGPRPG